MQQEAFAERLGTIMRHLYDAAGGDPAPLCEILETELAPEPSEKYDSHEYVHAFINAITLGLLSRGCQTETDFVITAFAIGRKWGLMEASEAMTDFTDAEPAS